MRPAITPMTIPAMAPPERPPELLDSAPVRVTLAPVATGARNGTVVVGDEVAVSITKVLLVGSMGGEIPVELPELAPAAAAHWPDVRQYWSLAQQMLPQDDSPLSQLQVTAVAVAVAQAVVEAGTQTDVTTPPPPTAAVVVASPHHELPVLNLVTTSVSVSTQLLVQYFQYPAAALVAEHWAWLLESVKQASPPLQHN